MASPRRLPAKRKGGLLDGGAVARGGSPGGLLACIFEMARKVSGGIGGGAAASFAADRARILCGGGDGAAWSIRKIVERFFWAWIGVYVWRASAGVGILQLAVYGATIDRRV